MFCSCLSHPEIQYLTALEIMDSEVVPEQLSRDVASDGLESSCRRFEPSHHIVNSGPAFIGFKVARLFTNKRSESLEYTS